MRKAGIILLALVIGFFFGAGAWGEYVLGKFRAVGNQYKQVEESGRTNYVTGLLDGIELGSILDKEEISQLKDYVSQMSINQIKAIVEKYMNEHPEKWHYPVAPLIFQALRKARLKESKL